MSWGKGYVEFAYRAVSVSIATSRRFHSRFAPHGVVEGAGKGESPTSPDVYLVQGEAVLENGFRHGAALLAATSSILIFLLLFSGKHCCLSGLVFPILKPIPWPRSVALRRSIWCIPCIVRIVAVHVFVRRVGVVLCELRLREA